MRTPKQRITMAWVRGLIQRLGWFYLAAIGVSATGLWAFAEVAEEVVERGADPFNHAAMLAIHAHAHPVLDYMALALAQVGSVNGIVLGALLFGAWLARQGRTLDLLTLFAVVGGTGVLTYALKLAFRNPRPTLFSSMITEVTYSFPSGHSLMSFGLYGFIAGWLVAQAPREPWRWAVAAGCVWLAGLVALSRVYMGVHWPTDVLAGALVAISWLSVCAIGRRWLAPDSALR